jgi:DNA repair protein RadA/Sms
MARSSLQYVCQNCGTVTSKWAGKCDGCAQWNTLCEETTPVTPLKSTSKRLPDVEFVNLNEPSLVEENMRLVTNCKEFDRVCGGGLVQGSVTLVGGDPGIGKSTLLLQVLARLATHNKVAYISGEEGINQIRQRAVRLGVSQQNVLLAAHASLDTLLQTIYKTKDIAALVVDSIQTMCLNSIEASAGTVSQIRASTQELIKLAKKLNIAIILVGHVTKEGMIAGPKILEHMVDTVLYFEGERGHPFRLLRSVKNRFGPTDEIGVFDMTQEGLQEVKNPSALFITGRQESVIGACVFAGLEGTRPLLVEVQALVAPSFLPSPRRAVVGWDSSRLAMILAILETRCGLSFSNKDVYLSVVGGIRITEPAADMAVAAALISCVKATPLPSSLVAFGEISLSGEVRSVQQTEKRLKEAQKLGFSQALTPPCSRGSSLGVDKKDSLSSICCHNIRELHEWFKSHKG